MDLTRDIKKQNINMRVKVTGLKENKALTEVIGYQVIHTFIKRIIRRGRNNLHDSFVCKTSDEKNVRLKPLMITVNKTKGVVINSLMRALRTNLTEYVRKITYKELVNELVSHKLQSNLKNSLRKIYPLRSCEIKEMSLETKKKVIGREEDKEAKEKEETKEKVELKEESDKAEDKKAEVEEKKEKEEKKEEKPKADKPEDKAEVKKESKEEDKPKQEEDNSNKKEREVEEKKEKEEKIKPKKEKPQEKEVNNPENTKKQG